MSTNEIKMLESIEFARVLSEDNNCPVYAFGNGEKIRIVVRQDNNLRRSFGEIREGLESEGYWLVSIFESGHRVSA